MSEHNEVREALEEWIAEMKGFSPEKLAMTATMKLIDDLTERVQEIEYKLPKRWFPVTLVDATCCYNCKHYDHMEVTCSLHWIEGLPAGKVCDDFKMDD